MILAWKLWNIHSVFLFWPGGQAGAGLVIGAESLEYQTREIFCTNPLLPAAFGFIFC
jgi:hypothetical protein